MLYSLNLTFLDSHDTSMNVYLQLEMILGVFFKLQLYILCRKVSMFCMFLYMCHAL